jgi:4-aminobutyrate--pyruvate transaminase
MATDADQLHRDDIAHIVHPYSNLDTHTACGPTVITHGNGCYVYDDKGKRYLEGMAGLWCTSLGFSEDRLIQAATRQLQTLPYYHLFNHRSHPPAIELATRLVEIAPAGLNHVLFANSGSEANDSAVKLVWYYNNALNRPLKKKIISRRYGYHGVTVASGSLTGLSPIHADFDLPIPGIFHTDCPSHYHFALPGETEDAFAQRLADNLETLILREGPDTVAAFIAEPVIGAGGVIVPPGGYFPAIQRVLRKYEVLFIVDEVICGFARTGNLFGSDTYELKPDLMTVAKALSSAYQPISALLLADEIFAAMQGESRKQGVFAHGLTYAAHPVAAAVALETLNIYRDRDILGHVREISPYFLGRLHEFDEHPLVGQVRGVGLLAAVEVTANKREKKAPRNAPALGAWIQKRAAEYGLILRAIGPCLAFCPPLIVEREHVDELVAALKLALDDALPIAQQNQWL